ncbi:hypothetical protein [Gordonia sp. 852002-50395_SCH5434458]|uniref:hypothetical protein n=1 Tax=Gordonia sp. 852002-50395_SCH5434458 TaxID=1834090 RepID=UPI0007EB2CAD|nr:hypothetical protein [Gordonia sp. 852002-50395_SCH5434458]OBC01755.1 hypothetical protein A5785_17300 [Gordonia sp. 852002-50395_SCH5434458]
MTQHPDPTLTTSSGQRITVHRDEDTAQIIVTADGAEILVLRPNAALGLADALEAACHPTTA